MSARGCRPYTPRRVAHLHLLDIRPAGPDLGRHHEEWWVRDIGCDITTYLQPGPIPERRTS